MQTKFECNNITRRRRQLRNANVPTRSANSPGSKKEKTKLEEAKSAAAKAYAYMQECEDRLEEVKARVDEEQAKHQELACHCAPGVLAGDNSQVDPGLAQLLGMECFPVPEHLQQKLKQLHELSNDIKLAAKAGVDEQGAKPKPPIDDPVQKVAEPDAKRAKVDGEGDTDMVNEEEAAEPQPASSSTARRELVFNNERKAGRSRSRG